MLHHHFLIFLADDKVFILKMEKEELKNYRGYHTPGQSKFKQRAKNAIYISNANSFLHEITKSTIALILHKYGDFNFTDEVKDALKALDVAVNYSIKDWKEDPNLIVTEAVPNGDGKRRVDIVNCTKDDRWEVETDHKVKKENAITIYI